MHSFAPFLSFLVLFISLPLDLVLGHSVHSTPRHAGLAQRHNDLDPRLEDTRVPVNRNATLSTRDPGARMTRFETGLGACGGVNQDSDFIVALTQLQWDGGSHCYQPITITYNGVTAHAQVVDKCMICPYNGLDLTNSLFAYLNNGNIADGVITADWVWGDGAVTTITTTSSSSSTTTSTTSTTSTQDKSTPTTTSTTSQTTITTTTGQSSAAVTVTPTPASTPTPTGLWDQLNQLMLNFGGIIDHAGHETS